MARPRYRLTPALEQQITGFIRAGAYDWVAAEAAGIPWRVFRGWMRQGARKGRQPYRRFYQAVQQARGMARLRVEIEVREKDPRFWLRHGPGRELSPLPGWTNPVKPLPRKSLRPGDQFWSRSWLKLWRKILETLAPFPEARDLLVRTLGEDDKVTR